MIPGPEFYIRDTKKVALDLLGKVLHRRKANGEIISGRIVETEAYLGVDDPACHTFGDRRTARTGPMYLCGGHAYVYLIYGMHSCLNVVTRTEQEPEAVLLRALEPITRPREKIPKKDLTTNGPGKLCRHLEITRVQNGIMLWKKGEGLWIEDDGFILKPKQIVKAPRVGVDYAGEAAQWPLRFYVRDSAWVSKNGGSGRN